MEIVVDIRHDKNAEMRLKALDKLEEDIFKSVHIKIVDDDQDSPVAAVA